jgi:ubiquitin carboxyl-terminal hydrolase 25/28
MELALQNPFVESKEAAYFLHAIIIHDGLANNGHYYTYVFERAMKKWWKLDDHKVEEAEEKAVF